MADAKKQAKIVRQYRFFDAQLADAKRKLLKLAKKGKTEYRQNWACRGKWIEGAHSYYKRVHKLSKIEFVSTIYSHNVTWTLKA